MQVVEYPHKFIGGWLLNRTKFRPDGTLHACDSYRIFCSSGMRHGIFFLTKEDVTKLVNAPVCKNCINKMSLFGYNYSSGRFTDRNQ